MISPQEAVCEAQRLISRVKAVTEKSPFDPGAAKGWKKACAGVPLLVSTMGKTPFEFIVPVKDSAGRTISTIGVDAECGKWRWYSRTYPFEKFPLHDKFEAKKKIEKFLEEKGIKEKPLEPIIVSAPDRNIYWCFTLRKGFDAYSPVFADGLPFTSFPSASANKTKFNTVHQAIPMATGGDHGGSAQGEKQAQEGKVSSASAGQGVPAEYDIAGVPYHEQVTNYFCGPASIEMVFDFWGKDVNQYEIASVANASSSYGTYGTDLVRAAHFSSSSASIQNPNLRGYNERSLGYAVATRSWSDTALIDRRYSDLKSLISKNCPVVVLSYYDSTHSSTHFRVVKGYSNNLDVFVFHDPWYSGSISGPDLAINQMFFVDDLWTYSNRWGMLALPWKVEVEKPSAVRAGEIFEVGASVSYPGPEPMNGQYDAYDAFAKIAVPSGCEIVDGSAERPLSTITTTGTMGTATWKLRSDLDISDTSGIAVTTSGKVSGSSRSYSSYSDWIGGIGTQGRGTFKPTSRTWAHDSIGVTAPSTNWYLAEGCTAGGFETFILVQNPNSDSTQVSLSYMTSEGEVKGPNITLAPQSRTTFNVGSTVPNNWQVSTRVTSSKPVIAERSMYGSGRTWAHDSIGVTAPSTNWYLAEGCTAGGFETFILVQNPNSDST
ncbi:MAG: DUF5719 family protein, partial [Actinomycetota bacterium]|nr:DUF5719 family protein [Actinomycetota bacterium]